MQHIDLYTSSQCPHCHAVKQALSELESEQKITLTEHSIESEPLPHELAFIRSVPVTLIKRLPLIGSYTKDEIAQWLTFAENGTFEQAFITERLNSGDLDSMRQLVIARPALLETAVRLIGLTETPMQVKIGITAIFEMLDAGHIPQAVIAELKKLIMQDNISVITDALYMLALIHDRDSSDMIRPFLAHPHPAVREQAEDSLAMLGD